MEEKTKKIRKVSSRENENLLERIIGIFFIIIEIILGFRLVLKLLGANAANGFVSFIYNVSQVFVGVFQGIFSDASTEGLETTAVFEPGTLIAMVVVAIIAWIVLTLIATNKRSKVEKEEIIEEEDKDIK
jgi:heme/copper-type cytochrome/quinol oxidase subunit 4